MKIYGDACSGNCDKVRFVADHLQLDYQWVEVDSVNGETRTNNFLAINPRGQIPFLELSPGNGIAQSNAIIRYLAKGSKLIPEDAYQRAKVDEWMFWEANNHEFFVAGCIGHMTYMGKSKETRDPMRVSRGEQALQLMQQHLNSNAWFVGDTMSLADIALLAYTRRGHLGGFDMACLPAIQNWIKRCEGQLELQAAR